MKVFSEEDAFGEPFRPEIAVRRILFPVRYVLRPPLLEGVIAAAKKVGDTGFFVSVVESEGSPWTGEWRKLPEETRRVPYDWYVPVEQAANYYPTVKVYGTNNAIYSPSGKWGILISDEDHAVVGASGDFVATVSNHVAEMDSQVYEFLGYWKEIHEKRDRPGKRIDLTWLPRQLSHCYGKEKAKTLLEESGLEWLN